MMLASFATMCAALALVIWIKLRVVSTIPRQALADPEAATAAAGSADRSGHADANGGTDGPARAAVPR